MDEPREGATRATAGPWRFVLVFLVALWAIVPTIATVYGVLNPTTISYGSQVVIDIRPPYDTRIGEVYLPIAGGFRVGDRFSAAALPLDALYQLYGYSEPRIGDRLDVTVLRNGRTVALHIPASAMNANALAADATVIMFVNVIVACAAIALGAAIVLLRPGVMMWGLYLYIILLQAAGRVDLPFLPGSVTFPADTLEYVGGPIGAWGFVEFCGRFPDGRLLRSGRIMSALAAVIAIFIGTVFAVRNAAGILYPISSLPLFAADDKASLLHRAIDAGEVGLTVLAIAAMALRYRALNAPDRLKVRAVFIAIMIYCAYGITSTVIGHFVPFHVEPTMLDQVSYWTQYLYILIPITVLYAVLHYRMFEVRFVFSRALVYGVLAVAFVSVLRLITFLVSKELSEGKLAFVGLAVTLAFAFSAERLKSGMEMLLRKFVFREHSRALEELERIRAALVHADRPETVDRMLTEGAAHILRLTSGAVFRGGGAELQQMFAIGWPADAAHSIRVDALVAVEARTQREPVRFDAVRSRGLDLPRGQARPAVAIPLLYRSELSGLVLYGGHESGGDLEPDEIAALRALTESAAETYHHLDVIAMREALIALQPS